MEKNHWQRQQYKIPLFDIDWTLLKGGNKAAYDSFDYAFKLVYGINASIEEIVPHGMVDSQVMIEVLKLHGLSEEEVKTKLDKAVEVRVKYFMEHQSEGKSPPMPGVKELLTTLKELNLPMGLLTGNIRLIALRKLQLAGLRDYFSFGAFGDMAFKRVDLINVARIEVERTLNLSTANFVIVGDSPLDVVCAKEGKVPIIAVGAGPYSAKELTVSGANLVVSSFYEQQSIINFLKN